MQLLEFQAKELIAAANLPTPSGVVLAVGEMIPSLTLPCVVKSQVPVGGRGKLGGIQLVRNRRELKAAVATISQLSIKGHLPSHLLLEEAIKIERELYISLQVNRDDRRIDWIVSENGGIDIESHSGSVLIIDSGDPRAHDKIASVLEISRDMLSPLLHHLEQCFHDNDLLLLEINPLVLTKSHQNSPGGTLLCADAKIMVDDNARFRHSELAWPDTEPIKPLGGNIGVIANGAGMAMSTMDSIYAAGGRPANFLDIGGGTGEDVFVKNLAVINAMPGVQSIIVNIFAGITHCDDIARGIIAAKSQLPDLVPLYIRLEGTNRNEAAGLLEEAGIAMQPDLKTCIALAMGEGSENGRSGDREIEGKQESVRSEDRKIGREELSSQILDLRESQDADKRVTSGGAAPTFGGHTMDVKVGADQTAGSASSDLRREAGGGTYDRSGHILLNQPTIVQGITGHHGAFHTEKMLEAGTNIVAGVTPGKGGQFVHDVPVYSSVKNALKKHLATASVVFVPAPFAKYAVLEAIEAGIRLIVIITEGIPVHDMVFIHNKAVETNTTVVGPNCPGLIVPKSHKLGIIASHITLPGHTTIISRSGTLTYELSDALTKHAIGQRLILGIGGDPIQGMTFIEALKLAENDPGTDQIILVGEIGGEGEIRAADYIDEHITKPVYGLIVGHSLPPGQTFGHAGAIVSAKAEDAAAKTAYLASRGVAMSDTLDELICEIVA